MIEIESRASTLIHYINIQDLLLAPIVAKLAISLYRSLLQQSYSSDHQINVNQLRSLRIIIGAIIDILFAKCSSHVLWTLHHSSGPVQTIHH